MTVVPALEVMPFVVEDDANIVELTILVVPPVIVTALMEVMSVKTVLPADWVVVPKVEFEIPILPAVPEAVNTAVSAKVFEISKEPVPLLLMATLAANVTESK